MTVLGEMLLQIETQEISVERFEELADVFERVCVATGREIFGHGFQVDVSVESGSLFNRVMIVGSLLSALSWGTYDVIQHYPDFKKGVMEICDDAEKFGWDVCKKYIPSVGASKGGVHPKIRKALPGTIVNAMKMIEKFEQQEKVMSEDQRRNEINKIETRVRNILKKAVG